MEETVDLPVAIDPVRPRRSILAVWVEADHAVEERCRSSKLLSVTYLRYGTYRTSVLIDNLSARGQTRAWNITCCPRRNFFDRMSVLLEHL